MAHISVLGNKSAVVALAFLKMQEISVCFSTAFHVVIICDLSQMLSGSCVRLPAKHLNYNLRFSCMRICHEKVVPLAGYEAMFVSVHTHYFSYFSHFSQIC